MKKPTAAKVKQLSIDLFIIVLACSIGAFATVGILIPNGLTSGGVTGIVRLLQNFIPIDFSIMYYAGALIILILCAFTLGMKEARKILLLTILYPTILFVFERFPLELLEEKDTFLAVIYCGVFFGICSGLVFSRGYSFGGTDTIAKIIQKKFLPHIGLSKILLIVDAVIIIISGFVFGRNIALYALITVVILSKSIDYVLYGITTRIVQVEIITSKHVEVSDYIMTKVNRGVSLESIIGAYTGQKREKVIALCSPRESVLIKQFVANIDDAALITMIHVDNIWGIGAGFGDIHKD